MIKDIQEQSGASIKVSQKGDYVPGTSLRIITISGNQVHPTPVQACNTFFPGLLVCGRWVIPVLIEAMSVALEQEAASFAHQLVSAKIPPQ